MTNAPQIHNMILSSFCDLTMQLVRSHELTCSYFNFYLTNSMFNDNRSYANLITLLMNRVMEFWSIVLWYQKDKVSPKPWLDLFSPNCYFISDSFKWVTIEFFFSFVNKKLTSLKKSQSRFLYLRDLAIKFENWNMKNEFSIFNFPIKIEKWKLKNFYHFSIFNFEVKIEMRKNVLFHFDFKMKIEWHFRCTDWSMFS